MTRRLARGDTGLPWRTALGMLALLVLVVALIVNLAAGYHIFGTDKVGQDVFYQSAEKHPHRPGHRHTDHADHAAVRDLARDHGGLFRAAGSTT